MLVPQEEPVEVLRLHLQEVFVLWKQFALQEGGICRSFTHQKCQTLNTETLAKVNVDVGVLGVTRGNIKNSPSSHHVYSVSPDLWGTSVKVSTEGHLGPL